MVDGQSIIFHTRHSFIVEIQGIERATFSTCSELSKEIEPIEWREGGRLIPYKQAGLVSYPDVTLERGSTKDTDLYAWSEECGNAASQAGLVAPDYKRTVDIVQLRRDRSEKVRHRLHNAFVANYVHGDWDNDANEMNVESVTLAFDYAERIDT
jgi:phage tail-like protein